MKAHQIIPAAVTASVHETAHAGTLAMLQYFGGYVPVQDRETAYLAVYAVIAGILLTDRSQSMRIPQPSDN